MKKILMLFCGVSFVVLILSGCQTMSDTAQKVSDDLGDKALQAHAFVDVWKVTPSDPASNGAPTGKKVTIIGDVKSIPLTSDTASGKIVKDYAEYRKTKTPAWYNADNVTEEEYFIATGDNTAEVKAWLKAKKAKEEAEAKAVTENKLIK